MIGGTTMNEKENFIFLASWVDAIEAYDNAGQSELAGELAKQIIYYGTKGETTTDNPLITGVIKAMCAPLIDKAKKKYNTCKANGNKGGRPQMFDTEKIIELHNSGLSVEKIATEMGCSVQTVIKKLKTTTDDEI